MMQSERFTIFSAVYVILKKGNQIYLQRRFNTRFMDGKFDVISGHLDGGETARQTAVREAAEEAGITISPDDLIIKHTVHTRTNREYLNTIFQTEKWEGEPRLMEKDRCDEVGWFDLNNLPENLAPHVKQFLEKIQEGEYYSEWGWE